MPGVSRLEIDVAGGQLVLNPVEEKFIKVFANGYPVAVLGATVSSHGRSMHRSSTMASASEKVFAYGIPVCREGDVAGCGHIATGSENVIVGQPQE
jgi:uncharacterized Zn-binding protein involved in type VI secretion